MAYEFAPAKQATITFPEAGTSNKRKITFFTANDSLTAQAALEAANTLFDIGGIIVAVAGAEKTETEVAELNG